MDVSYAKHDAMKVHDDCCMTFGWGLTHAKSSKKRLNTKCSMYSEVFGSIKYIPFGIWLDMYIEHQWYRVKQNQLMQDNMSTIKMKKNCQSSFTVNYQHINIRFFFVKKRVNKKILKLFIVPLRLC